MTTPNTGLPYIEAQQSQPEVTFAEALNLLSILLYGVISEGDTAPPGSPAEGDTYIVGVGATGAWATRDNCIAGYIGGGWIFFPAYDDDGAAIAMSTAQEGLTIWVKDRNCAYTWTGSSWLAAGSAMGEEYSSGALPSAAGPKRWAYFINEQVPIYNDGTNWRRCTDGGIVT